MPKLPETRNPLTGQPVSNTESLFDRAAKEAPERHRRYTPVDHPRLVRFGQEEGGLPETGTRPRAARWFVVGAFSIANLLSLGRLGQAGLSALHDVRSGTCKNAVRKDLAKTYLYASEGKDKGFNWLTKTYTNFAPIGLVERGLTAIYRRYFSETEKMARKNFEKQKSLRADLASSISNDFGIHTNYDSVKTYNKDKLQQDRAGYYARLQREILLDNDGNKAAEPNLNRVLNGSRGLRSAFQNFAKRKGADQNFIVQQWLTPELDKLCSEPEEPQQDYGLNKYQLLVARDRFISPADADAKKADVKEADAKKKGNLLDTRIGGKASQDSIEDGQNIGVDEQATKALASKIDKALGDFPKRYYETVKRFARLHEEFEERTWDGDQDWDYAKSGFKETQDQVEKTRKQLLKLKKEAITPLQSQDMCPELYEVETQLKFAIKDTFRDFAAHVQETAEELPPKARQWDNDESYRGALQASPPRSQAAARQRRQLAIVKECQKNMTKTERTIQWIAKRTQQDNPAWQWAKEELKEMKAQAMTKPGIKQENVDNAKKCTQEAINRACGAEPLQVELTDRQKNRLRTLDNKIGALLDKV